MSIDEDQRVRGLILASDLNPRDINAALPKVFEHHLAACVAADPNDDADGQSQSRRGGRDIPFDTPWSRLPVENHDASVALGKHRDTVDVVDDGAANGNEIERAGRHLAAL
jgi:hypothetical protein